MYMYIINQFFNRTMIYRYSIKLYVHAVNMVPFAGLKLGKNIQLKPKSSKKSLSENKERSTDAALEECRVESRVSALRKDRFDLRWF